MFLESSPWRGSFAFLPLVYRLLSAYPVSFPLLTVLPSLFLLFSLLHYMLGVS
jgi:hypothetical protein